ncbi:MAG TPA: hypothetical protein VFO65_13920 [Acidimicrobiales bacterium]|nr:hypothetical protein [Acidimicrobiales bacterium]
MFQLLKAVSALDLFRRQLPLLVVSLLIADTFYKFHSFLRESVAFLATWFVLDMVVQAVVAVAGSRSEGDRHPVG